MQRGCWTQPPRAEVEEEAPVVVVEREKNQPDEKF